VPAPPINPMRPGAQRAADCSVGHRLSERSSAGSEPTDLIADLALLVGRGLIEPVAGADGVIRYCAAT
jgi:hypothetical protein